MMLSRFDIKIGAVEKICCIRTGRETFGTYNLFKISFLAFCTHLLIQVKQMFNGAHYKFSSQDIQILH
jgi:hypothetical protein